MLEEFLGRPEVSSRMSRDYVDLAIDTDRMTQGQEVFDRMKRGRSGGLPWLIILDSDGTELISGVGPDGNIGAPVQPEECAHFIEMLRKTRQRMTDDDLSVITEQLEEHAKSRRRRR